jgi:integrase/recombinase XerD
VIPNSIVDAEPDEPAKRQIEVEPLHQLSLGADREERLTLTTAYAAGLRVSEVVGIKVENIDSQRMVIRIEHGKGGKDRYVMLSAARMLS